MYPNASLRWLGGLFGGVGLLLACGGAADAPAAENALTGQPTAFHTDFEGDAVGAAPSGFETHLGGWRVEEADGGRVLRQVLPLAGMAFPRIALQRHTFADLTLEVRCRTEGGAEDQACGVIFRAQDADNYYVARANALEDNVRLYRVVGGLRQQFGSANRTVVTGRWHTLAVRAEGEALSVSFDGQEVIHERDGTFSAGAVGLWTKADSVTAFDDFSVEGR